MLEFKAFPKIPRLNRGVFITEKIDGTNAAIVISDDGTEIAAQSRTRIITPDNDNFGFATWVQQNREELLTLGPGYHYGEWYGRGIQRNYGLQDRRFALFNVGRYNQHNRPSIVEVVPVLAEGVGFDRNVARVLDMLRSDGSVAVPGFMKPEGIVVFHSASRTMHKVLLENDELPKGLSSVA